MKIVLIAPNFFDYYKRIIESLESKGHDVIFINERLNNSVFIKLISRIFSFIVPYLMGKYFKRHIEQIGCCDLVLIIKGETMSERVIERFESICSGNLYFYNWDSFKNNPNSKKLIYKVRKFVTFDRSDAEKYELEYLPLWHSQKNNYENFDKDIDISFVGTIHTDRLKILNEFHFLCQNQGIKTKFYYYFPSGFLFRIKLLFLRCNPFRIPGNVYFNKLSFEDYCKIVKRSAVVLDIERKVQSGITIRVIEALSMGCKIVTTNQHVFNESFYDPENILIVPRDLKFVDFKAVEDFIQKPVNRNSSDLVSHLHIDSWIDRLLGFDLNVD